MQTQKAFFTLDVETFVIKGVHRPFAASLYRFEGETKKNLTQVCRLSAFLLFESLFSRCFSHFPQRRYVFYCHNLGRFEGPLLTEFFVRHPACKVENLLIHENRLVSLEVRLKGRRLVFKDSLNFLPLPLGQLNRLFFPSKKKTALPFNPFDPRCAKLSLSLYVKHDARVLGLLLHVFRISIQKELLLDPMRQFGTPGTALRAYSRFFQKENVFSSEKKSVRRSFKGGLNFLEKDSGGPVYAFDVNSLYPACMLNRLPVGRPKAEKEVKLEGFFGFVFVTSLKKRDDPTAEAFGKTKELFPWERPNVPCVLFSEEAKYACRLGYVLKIEGGLRYASSFGLFHQFVNHFYNLKKTHRAMNSLTAKLMMNSLYGKLGMKSDHPSYQIVDRQDLSRLTVEGKNVKLIKSFSTNAHLIENREENEFRLPLISTPIASAIASYGRMTIHRWISRKELGTRYSDTDSLFTSAALPVEAVNPHLGGFKRLSPTPWKESLFLKPKLYGLKSDARSVNKVKSVKNPKWEHLQELEREKSLRLHQQRWFVRKNHVLTLVQRLELKIPENGFSAPLH